MQNKEYFDVLDEQGHKTGQIKLRSEVHLDGDWHASVHVWIMNSRGELLMQRRSPQKDTGANMWDISYGGHVQSGNTSLEEAFREGSEELGLELEESDLTYLFTVTQNYLSSDRVDRELNEVYLIQKDFDPEDLILQEDEVAEVKFIPWIEVAQNIESDNPDYCRHPEEYLKLFEYLSKKNRLLPD